MKKLISFALILLPLYAGAINHSDSIPYPFYHEDQSGETQMMPLHRGEESLQLRLELIQKAQKTIEVEYYIYYMDMAGKICPPVPPPAIINLYVFVLSMYGFYYLFFRWFA